jgi:hypothetical protein
MSLLEPVARRDQMAYPTHQLMNAANAANRRFQAAESFHKLVKGDRTVSFHITPAGAEVGWGSHDSDDLVTVARARQLWTRLVSEGWKAQ